MPSVVGWCARRGALCVGLAAIVVYLNALPNGFTYDDVPVIVENPATDPAAPWWEPWRRTWWSLGEWAGDADRPYRPLTVQTFALERRLFGDRPLPFHAVNVLLHGAISVAVWWLARRLGASALAGLLAGMLFAVHPIHTEAVANIVGRAELMSIGGMLLAIWFYDRRIRHGAPSGSSRRLPTGRDSILPAARWVFCWGGVLLASAAAIFSKERGVAVVAILAAWHLGSQVEFRRSARRPALAGKPPVAPRAQLRPSRASLCCSWLKPALPALAVVVVYLFLRVEISGTLFFAGERYGPDNPLREADALARVLTPFALLGRYLWLVIVPARLLCNYSVNVLEPTYSLLDPFFITGIVFVAVVVVVAVRRFRSEPLWLLLVFCFAATYFLASNSVILLETMFAERWFYGPAVWLCVAVGLMFDRVAARRRKSAQARPALVTFCIGAVLAGLAGRSMLRNTEWVDNDTLFGSDLARMEPGRRSSHLCYLVGAGHRARGERALARGDLQAAGSEFAQAEALLLEAAAIFPDYPDYYRALGQTYLVMNQPDEAVRWLEMAWLHQRRDTTIQTLLETARSRRRGVDLPAALQAARQAAQNQPDDADMVRRWAELAEKIDLLQAADAYRRLTELAPDEVTSWTGLAYALAGSGRVGEAAAAYRNILNRWPANWEAHANLAMLLMNSADRRHYEPAQAIEHARRAVTLNPDSIQVRINLAEVLAHCGQIEEAAEMFETFADQAPPGSEQEKQYRKQAASLRGRN
ncbi:MAG: tetratricopeptide repeat protein [Planctomycetota bacterium]|nr:tetratricopeptide repeat protein [Planctomycetota bacterium]